MEEGPRLKHTGPGEHSRIFGGNAKTQDRANSMATGNIDKRRKNKNQKDKERREKTDRRERQKRVDERRLAGYGEIIPDRRQKTRRLIARRLERKRRLKERRNI